VCWHARNDTLGGSPALIAPAAIADILGLGTAIRTLDELEKAVASGLPKQSLALLCDRLYRKPRKARACIARIVPETTWKWRIATLSVGESQRTERLARVLAQAEQV